MCILCRHFLRENKTHIEGMRLLAEIGTRVGVLTDAEFLLDFLSKELGPHYYNRGLYDAQAVMQKHIDAVVESIYEIEKPVG